jgi:hypothetical protein
MKDSQQGDTQQTSQKVVDKVGGAQLTGDKKRKMTYTGDPSMDGAGKQTTAGAGDHELMAQAINEGRPSKRTTGDVGEGTTCGVSDQRWAVWKGTMDGVGN